MDEIKNHVQDNMWEAYNPGNDTSSRKLQTETESKFFLTEVFADD